MDERKETPWPRDTARKGHGPSRSAALLDLDLFRANAAAMAARAAGTPIRVASKSLRVRRALDEALAHPGYRGVLAFTLPEALWLAGHGADDVVVAYPSTDRAALAALLRGEAHRHVTLMVDSPEHLGLLAAAARDAGSPSGRRFRVCLDLDASYAPVRTWPRGPRIGPLRSPVRTAEQAVRLARAAADAGVDVVGLMAYEGQVAGVADAARTPRGAAVRALRTLSIRDLATWRAEVVAAVRAALGQGSGPATGQGAGLEFVNGGGTGSLESTAAEDAVTELAAGSGFYGPELFQHYRGFRPAPALHVLFGVVRRPGPRTVTVLGGGWTASGPAGPDRLPVPVWPPGLRYSATEGAGEVQTPLTGAAAAGIRLGDPVYFRHAKAGEPCERLGEVHVFSGGRITDTWPTYRGEGRAFL
ncbi:alanine racemase [Zafaria sp. Z1313]|uniref:alanine racemase n=1 Tax=Zafaria sp. Z1313 TaxID=3423202 RepID=UPI003D303985